jgi:hypothetical protein
MENKLFYEIFFRNFYIYKNFTYPFCKYFSIIFSIIGMEEESS